MIQRGFDAFAAGDMAVTPEQPSPDITWHSPGNNIHMAAGKASEVWLLGDNQAATDDLWS